MPIDSSLSRVYDGDNLFIVNLKDKTCSCRRFDLDQIPCRHALAVIAKKRLGAYSYCSHYYTKEELLASYEETIRPLGNPKTWSIPNEVKSMEVLPPVSAEKSGSRSRRKRTPPAGEEPPQVKCGRCNKYGHNRKTCKNPPALRSSRGKPKKTSTNGRSDGFSNAIESAEGFANALEAAAADGVANAMEAAAAADGVANALEAAAAADGVDNATEPAAAADGVDNATEPAAAADGVANATEPAAAAAAGGIANATEPAAAADGVANAMESAE